MEITSQTRTLSPKSRSATLSANLTLASAIARYFYLSLLIMGQSASIPQEPVSSLPIRFQDDETSRNIRGLSVGAPWSVSYESEVALYYDLKIEKIGRT